MVSNRSSSLLGGLDGGLGGGESSRAMATIETPAVVQEPRGKWQTTCWKMRGSNDLSSQAKKKNKKNGFVGLGITR